MKSGLVSVSFRWLTPDEIIKATAAAGLQGIEWGSDVHVPPDHPVLAKAVRDKTVDAGLTVSAYGTYFGLGKNSTDEFQKYLETAEILGTNILRIWPPDKFRDKLSAEEYLHIVSNAETIAEMAKKCNKTVCLECHHETFTDNYKDEVNLIKDVGYDNFKTYWQPNFYKDLTYNISSAKALQPYVENVHVFNWKGNQRFPLSDGVDEWKQYINILQCDSADRWYLLEFMHDDKPTSLNPSASVLNRLIKYK